MSLTLIIIFIVTVLALGVFVIKHNEAQKQIETLTNHKTALQNDVKRYKDKFEDANTSNVQQSKRLADSYHFINNLEDAIFERLRFITPEGEVAHNVKVKTIQNTDGDILNIVATIRRKVGDKYKDVPLTATFIKP